MIGGMQLASWARLMSASSSSASFVRKSEAEWRAVLTPQHFRVLRQQATEPPGSGEYNKHYPSSGIYRCVGCQAPLFRANTKVSLPSFR